MIGKASGFAGVIYVIIYVYCYDLLGETPVNLLGHGGSSGASNLIFNITAYAIMTMVICLMPSLFFKNKKKWLIQVVVGCLVTAALMFLFTILHLAITWR